jgi:hypothetical protein
METTIHAGGQQRRQNKFELYTPTNAARMPMKSKAATASRLRTPLDEGKLTYSNSTAKRLTRHVTLFQLTREGHGRFFHSVPSGPNFGNGCDRRSYVFSRAMSFWSKSSNRF